MDPILIRRDINLLRVSVARSGYSFNAIRFMSFPYGLPLSIVSEKKTYILTEGEKLDVDRTT